MIGIVIPAHNEEHYLPACLQAARVAAGHAALNGETVEIVVVLDACSDNSADIVAAHGVTQLCVDARNVGESRARGADYLLAAGARWLAFTDADTIVSPDWLSTQLSLGVDAVCGSIAVLDWSPHSVEVRSRFEAHYRDLDGHRHIHGANLGVSSAAYVAAGGFPPLAVSEDVALVTALEQGGWRIAWSAAPRVATSARRQCRARGGFADFLLGLCDPAAGAMAAG
jgi:glycosyltransferase involved in cell wall biosynthesis